MTRSLYEPVSGGEAAPQPVEENVLFFVGTNESFHGEALLDPYVEIWIPIHPLWAWSPTWGVKVVVWEVKGVGAEKYLVGAPFRPWVWGAKEGPQFYIHWVGWVLLVNLPTFCLVLLVMREGSEGWGYWFRGEDREYWEPRLGQVKVRSWATRWCHVSLFLVRLGGDFFYFYFY